jgi:hypothetical protein
MPAPLRIALTEADDHMLSELRVAATVPQRTRVRARMLRLNALQVERSGLTQKCSSAMNIRFEARLNAGPQVACQGCGRLLVEVQNGDGPTRIWSTSRPA